MGLKHTLLMLFALGTLTLAGNVQAHTPPAQKTTFKTWGLDTLQHIDQVFWRPGAGVYASSYTLGKSADNTAVMWGCGVEFSALNAAAQLDPDTYLPEVKRMIQSIGLYWVFDHGVGGYEVLPRPNPTDRYYDDNEWIVLDLADAYDETHDPQVLQRCKDTFKFVLSGEDNVLGGGIYWHEQQKNSKNTCSNGPAIVGALRLYQLTHDPTYLTTAQSLYTWVNSNLQDTDGLYFDNININGKVSKQKYSYNSALMIRANVLFYQVTHQKKYLTEAERIATAAAAHWIDPQTGAINDGAAFAHLLSESFLYLYTQDHDSQWAKIVERALIYLHTDVLNANGDYGGSWNKPAGTSTGASLMDDASAARGFLIADVILTRPIHAQTKVNK